MSHLLGEGFVQGEGQDLSIIHSCFLSENRIGYALDRRSRLIACAPSLAALRVNALYTEYPHHHGVETASPPGGWKAVPKEWSVYRPR